jgi:hypothetical protein
MWYQADLGTVHMLDAIKVMCPGRGFPAGYRVDISADGVAWAMVGAKEKNWSDFGVSFAPYPVRYIHITQTGTTQWAAQWQISEVFVREAGAWNAVASHSPELVGFALDNNPTTQWTTGVPQQEGMSFTLDMGLVQSVTGVLLDNGDKPQYPQGFSVKVSADGNNWSEVARSPDAGNWRALDVTFNATPARYIHIECTSNNRWHPWSINQFTVRREVRPSEWRVLQ